MAPTPTSGPASCRFAASSPATSSRSTCSLPPARYRRLHRPCGGVSQPTAHQTWWPKHRLQQRRLLPRQRPRPRLFVQPRREEKRPLLRNRSRRRRRTSRLRLSPRRVVQRQRLVALRPSWPLRQPPRQCHRSLLRPPRGDRGELRVHWSGRHTWGGARARGTKARPMVVGAAAVQRRSPRPLPTLATGVLARGTSREAAIGEALPVVAVAALRLWRCAPLLRRRERRRPPMRPPRKLLQNARSCAQRSRNSKLRPTAPTALTATTTLWAVRWQMTTSRLLQIVTTRMLLPQLRPRLRPPLLPPLRPPLKLLLCKRRPRRLPRARLRLLLRPP